MIAVTKFARMLIYDIILIFSLIMSGLSAGLKIYALTFAFIVVAFLCHVRLTRMLELGEE